MRLANCVLEGVISTVIQTRRTVPNLIVSKLTGSAILERAIPLKASVSAGQDLWEQSAIWRVLSGQMARFASEEALAPPLSVTVL